MTIIAQGAEAIIRKIDGKIVKERIAKEYRIPEIDVSFRKYRTRREAKVLTKLADLGIAAPHLFAVDDKKMIIEMEFLDGEKLRDVFDQKPREFSSEVGKLIAQLHTHNIIHADLTTSNMILCNGKIHLIDFGLSFFSTKVEDRAVDLHVLERALESKHFESYPKTWEEVLDSYRKEYPGANEVLERLEKVQKRGRNKK